MTASSGEAGPELHLDLLQSSQMRDSQMYSQDFIEASFETDRRNGKLKMHGLTAG